MQDNPFVILGISADSSREEIQSAYEKLHKKYAEERFLEGEAGAEAARMYTKVEIAYQDALDQLEFREKEKQASTGNPSFDEVITNLKSNNISKAQQVLDDMVTRGSEWHYWQAAVYYKKNWFDESKTQIKIALELEPNNQKYKDTLAKIEKEQNANNAFSQQPNNQNQQQFDRTYSQQQQQAPMAGGCCDCCSSLICADCCCEMCGGDLISCC